MKPFDFVENILTGKEPLPKEEVLSHYPEFYVNVALSALSQNILLVQELNKNAFISKHAQYLFYFYGCDKMYRIPYSKLDVDKNEISKDIMEKCRLAFTCMSDEQIKEILPFVIDEIQKIELNKVERVKC